MFKTSLATELRKYITASVPRLENHYCNRTRSKLSELVTSNCTLNLVFIHYIAVSSQPLKATYKKRSL